MSNLLTISQIAEKLNVSKRTIMRYLKDQKIPAVILPNGIARFDEKEIERWLGTRVVKANPKPVL